MLDRFTGMELFSALVRRGTFSAAAEELGISRAMASKHIQALEARLGVRLFNRTTRRTRLTEAGERYYEGISSIFAELEQLETVLLDDTAQVRGTLSIAAPPAFGAFHLSPIIAEFMRTQPDIRVRLTLSDRHIDLVEEGIDLAVTVRDLEDTNFIARHLADVQMMVCAAPAYLRRRGVPQHPRDLSSHNCLIFADSSVDMRAQWLFAHRNQPITVTVSGNFAANQGHALRHLALSGHGVARLPGYMIGEDIAAGRLRALLMDFAPALRPVHAVYPHREHVAGKVRSFLSFAVNAFRVSSDQSDKQIDAKSSTPTDDGGKL